jgi:hypothetical protein
MFCISARLHRLPKISCFVSAHCFTGCRKSHVFVSGHDFAGCGKTHLLEGYGLQAVRKCFAMNPALATEGYLPLQRGLFRSLFSPRVRFLNGTAFTSARDEGLGFTGGRKTTVLCQGTTSVVPNSRLMRALAPEVFALLPACPACRGCRLFPQPVQPSGTFF